MKTITGYTVTKIIKEYIEEGGACIIRTNTFAHAHGYFKMLIREAKKDFPDLDENKINIIHYCGPRHKGTWGITFRSESAPAEYIRINEVFYTL